MSGVMKPYPNLYCHEKALTENKKIDDAVFELLEVGDHESAEVTKAFALAKDGVEAEKDAVKKAFAKVTVAKVTYAFAKLKDALKLADEALETFVSNKNKKGEAMAKSVKALICSDMKSPDEALTCADEALGIFKDLKSVPGQSMALVAKIYCLLQDQEPPAAEPCAKELVTLAGSDKMAMVLASLKLSEVYLNWGKPTESVPEAKKAVTTATAMGDKTLQGKALIANSNACIYGSTEGPESDIMSKEAISTARQALKCFEKDTYGKACSYIALSQAAEKIRDDYEAVFAAEEAIKIYTKIGAKEREAQAQNKIAMTHISKIIDMQRAGSEPKYAADLAYKAAKAAKDLFKEAGVEAGEASACLNMCRSLFAKGGFIDEALSAAKMAEDLYQRVGDDDGEAMALYLMASGNMAKGKTAEAAAMAGQAAGLFGDAGNAEGEFAAMEIVKEVKGPGAMAPSQQESGVEQAQKALAQQLPVVYKQKTGLSSAMVGNEDTDFRLFYPVPAEAKRESTTNLILKFDGFRSRTIKSAPTMMSSSKGGGPSKRSGGGKQLGPAVKKEFRGNAYAPENMWG